MSKLCHMSITIVFMLNILTVVISLGVELIDSVLGDTGSKVKELGKKTKNQLEHVIGMMQDQIKQMNKIVDNLQTEMNIISKFLTKLPEIIKRTVRVHALEKYVQRLDKLYKDYKNYSKNITLFENLTLARFAEKVLHGSQPVGSVIAQIQDLVFPNPGILHSMSKSLQNLDSSEWCSLNQSTYQTVYHVYNYITLMELKGYIIMRFSYMILKLQKKGDFTKEMEDLKNKYETNTRTMADRFENITKPLSRDIWKCDPKVHNRSTDAAITTFIELTSLKQIRDDSNTHFSLWPVTADIKNNRVVTGLRFVEVNRIIYIQIQEGKLLPGGEIDVSTVKWVNVEVQNINKSSNGKDYYALTLDERSLDLDHLLTDPKHVLTGIRFIKWESHLQIAIASTGFDILTGLLKKVPMELKWKYGSTSPRSNLEFKARDPMASPLPYVSNFKPNQYVTYTSLEKDRTLPFLDAQPVESSLPTPLGGAGIYYKGKPNSGGFIAPIITTYNFNQHLPVLCYK